MKIFDRLSETEQKVLIELEQRDSKERENHVESKLRLRQIPRETGEYLYGLVSTASLSKKNWLGIEIGSSGGYSTVWQGLALKYQQSGKLISLEIDEKKIVTAKANLEKTELGKYVTLVHTDAKEYMKSTKDIFDYAFVDAEKSDYQEYIILLLKKVRKGSICVVDNVISHADDLKGFLAFLDQEKALSYTILTIGKGEAFILFK